MVSQRFLVTVLSASLGTLAAGAEPDATDVAEFEAHVRPFFAKHCVKCHGEKKQKADFALHDIDGLVTSVGIRGNSCFDCS